MPSFKTLEQAIRTGDLEGGVAATQELLDEGVDPLSIFTDCIEPVLDDIGEKFSRLEIFLPEMVNASKVVKAIHKKVKPHMEANETSTSKGRIVIATVSGDLHDIGKNIVKAMLEVNGFEVKDLGVDVATQTIVSEARDYNADVIALSALMLPSLPFCKDVIEFVEQDKSSKVIVGGGPVSKEWAEEAGADGYGDNAIDAVALVNMLVSA
jgi:5-methyltetrahydrofolate--homocysteine methyltransferase